MERKEQGTVQALERGLKILELLMQEKRPMGVNDVGGVPDLKDAGDKRLEFPDVRRQIHSGREVILYHGEK